MTTRAALAAVMIALSLVVPASAEPFDEVSATHWAYEALTDLAGGGLIEGYPQGTFQPDRLITRYEAAIIISRVLARIDAVHVTALPSHLAGVQRLVVEFRTELNALGVHAAAAEAELARLRVKTAGATTFLSPDPRLGIGAESAEIGLSREEHGLHLRAGNLVDAARLAKPRTYALRFASRERMEASFGSRSADPQWSMSPRALLWALNDGGPDMLPDVTNPVTLTHVPVSVAGMTLAVADTRVAAGLPPVWVLASGATGLTVAQHTERSVFGPARGYQDFVSSVPRDLAVEVSELSADGYGVDSATSSAIPSLATPDVRATAWRIGEPLDVSRWGMDNWNASVEIAHRSHPSGFLFGSGSASLTTMPGIPHDSSWNARGWVARLNLSLTSRTTGSIVYERGQVITTGQAYAQWGLRMAHQMAPNATLTLQYHRVRCGNVGGTPCPGLMTAGEVDRVYRAELLYSW